MNQPYGHGPQGPQGMPGPHGVPGGAGPGGAPWQAPGHHQQAQYQQQPGHGWPPQQPPYGAVPPGGWPAPSRGADGLSITALVFGILALLGAGALVFASLGLIVLILAVIGLSVSITALIKARAAGRPTTLSVVGLVLAGASIVVTVAIAAVAVSLE